MTTSVVKGVGHYLPKKVVPNCEFESHLNTSDEWIRTRTGIQQRHFAAEGECTSDLALHAAKEALKLSNFHPDDIDLIVLATSTPDLTFPSTATKVQAELGMKGGFAFDLQAVCAGFVYALSNANALLVSGQAKRALVIGAETFSRILDMNDRSTCVLFGDGAGALVLEAQPSCGDSEERGIISTDIHSDGNYRELLYVDGGVSSTQTTGFLRMDGPGVFRHAVEKLCESATNALIKANLTSDDVDLVVPHQANMRIIRATAKKLEIPEEKIIITVGQHGNTSAASIPLALYTAYKQGRVKKGDVLVAKAIGGGLTWGSVVIRW